MTNYHTKCDRFWLYLSRGACSLRSYLKSYSKGRNGQQLLRPSNTFFKLYKKRKWSFLSAMIMQKVFPIDKNIFFLKTCKLQSKPLVLCIFITRMKIVLRFSLVKTAHNREEYYCPFQRKGSWNMFKSQKR